MNIDTQPLINSILQVPNFLIKASTGALIVIFLEPFIIQDHRAEELELEVPFYICILHDVILETLREMPLVFEGQDIAAADVVSGVNKEEESVASESVRGITEVSKEVPTQLRVTNCINVAC